MSSGMPNRFEFWLLLLVLIRLCPLPGVWAPTANNTMFMTSFIITFSFYQILGVHMALTEAMWAVHKHL
jgi:hypothetical protein